MSERPTLRRRGLLSLRGLRRTNSQIARSGETAVLMQADMWVMPISTFLALDRLRPHQELLAARKLVRWDASMPSIIFLSHQWTSFDHPDHTTQQLRAVQRLLARMVCDQCPETALSATDRLLFPKNVKITPVGWREIAEKAFIWMDYFSVRAAAAASANGESRLEESSSVKRQTAPPGRVLMHSHTSRCPVRWRAILWELRGAACMILCATCWLAHRCRKSAAITIQMR